MITKTEIALLSALALTILVVLAWIILRREAARTEPVVPGPLRRFFYGLTYYVGRLLLKILFRYSVHGSEKIPNGPVVLVANHASFLDPIFIAGTTRRWVRFMMYASFYNSPAKPIFLFFACIPVDERRFLESLKTGAKLLERGDCLGIFPEGAVSADGKLQRARPGALFLAQRTGAPVVPITIIGNHAVFPRGAWIPRPRKLTLIVGEPFHVDKDLPKEDVEKKLDGVMAEFAKNLGQEWTPRARDVAAADLPPEKPA